MSQRVIRRTMVSAAMTALLVVGMAGTASGDGGGSGTHGCRHIAEKVLQAQRHIDRIERERAQADGHRTRRLARLQQHQDRIEQQLQSLGNGCQA